MRVREVVAATGDAPNPGHLPPGPAARRRPGLGAAERGGRSRQVERVDVFSAETFDRVITLCDRAREACPEPPAAPVVAHWSVPNPAEAHPADLDAFRATAKEVRTRVRCLLPLLGNARPA
jgi:protein-tyrosine-phosphatase